jgi:GGDEF domain-containing protein
MISIASQASINRLKELQERLERASMLEEVRALRAELSDCIQLICTECGLQENPEIQSKEASPDLDPLTGSPLRPGAEEAMKSASDAGAHIYAGLFVIDRMQVINSRFGSKLGDQVLLYFVQHLSAALTGKDTLYRWGPTSFLALLDRLESLDQVRREIVRTMTKRREQTFEIGDRSVILPISSTWIVIPLFEQGYSEILQKLEAFDGSPSGPKR